MPKVILTQRRVRACPHPSTGLGAPASNRSADLSWENLIYLADFFQASGERIFCLAGTEPTQHPEFNNFVLYLLERNFHVRVITNGIVPPEVCEETAALFSDIPAEGLHFTCNLEDPQETDLSPADLQRIHSFLKFLGDRIVPAFKIRHPNFDLLFLFQQINECGLMRDIRLSLLQPVLGKKRPFVEVKEIAPVIDRLFSFAPHFERLRIKFHLDCGFPLCRFSEAQLGWLYVHTNGLPGFTCDPVIEIGPDMTLWSCNSLSAFHKKSVFEFNSVGEIHRYYRRLFETIKVEAGGVLAECDDCEFREVKTCSGGCLAHSLMHFQDESRLRMKDVYL